MAEPDLSEFEGYSKPRKKDCALATAAKSLSEADQRSLEAALATDTSRITNAGIAAWFAARGHGEILWQQVSSHRRGICPCGKAQA